LGKYVKHKYQGPRLDGNRLSLPEPGERIPAMANKPQPLPKSGRKGAESRPANEDGPLSRRNAVDPQTHTGHRARVCEFSRLARGTNQGCPSCGPRGPSAPTKAHVSREVEWATTIHLRVPLLAFAPWDKPAIIHSRWPSGFYTKG
jgi:hypothetical protein